MVFKLINKVSLLDTVPPNKQNDKHKQSDDHNVKLVLK